MSLGLNLDVPIVILDLREDCFYCVEVWRVLNVVYKRDIWAVALCSNLFRIMKCQVPFFKLCEKSWKICCSSEWLNLIHTKASLVSDGSDDS